MSSGGTHYQLYLLRLWRDEAGELMHASLQSTASGSVHHLKDLDSLLTFLSARQHSAVASQFIEETPEDFEEDNGGQPHND